MKGKVFLVGAGPGDPELLTVKAIRVLHSADVVLHDALVSTGVLEMVPASTRVLNVGKRCGTKSISQEEINALLVNLAADGKCVVRLKNGDPLIFGRAGEEIEALRAAGIEVEVVPGVTTALAAAAAARIPLTDRRDCERLLLISAHHAADKADLDWDGSIPPRTTVVVYMPGFQGRIVDRLIQAGLSDRTPCAVLSRISLPDEQLHRCTLGELCEAPPLPPPTLLIVGQTAAKSAVSEAQMCTNAFGRRSPPERRDSPRVRSQDFSA